MLPANGPAASTLQRALQYDAQPQQWAYRELSVGSATVCIVAGESSRRFSNLAIISHGNSEAVLTSPTQCPESFAGHAGETSLSFRQGGGSVVQLLNPNSPARRGGCSSKMRLFQCLRRWLCSSSCSGRSDSKDGRGSVRRAGPRMQLRFRSLSSQAIAGSPSNSMGGRSRRSTPSAGGRLPSSTAGVMGGVNSSSGSVNSHLGPLPSRRLQLLHDSSQENPWNAHASISTTDGLFQALQPHHAVSSLAAAPPCLGSGSNIISSAGGGPTTGPLPLGLPNSLAGTGMSNPGPLAAAVGSRASSVASCTSGTTTTSRPSRWGLLAGILSAGLRSFSQLAHVVEPDTGNLSWEAVHDLTRRASRLDVVRAAGQVSDLSWVGSGSMGLVYRGRITNGSGTGDRTVCIKYLVARGAEGMAAPATEGLLSRALAHPNIISTFSWYVTRVTSESFLDLPDALAAMASREPQCRSCISTKHSRRGGMPMVGMFRRSGCSGGTGGSSGGLRDSAAPIAAAGTSARQTKSSSTTLPPTVVLGLACSGGDGGHSGGCNCGGNGATGPGSVGVEYDMAGRDGSQVKVSSRAASATYTPNILEMVGGSGSTGDVIGRARAWSPGESPLTHVVFSHHRSFTGAAATTRMVAQREAIATLLLRASANPSDGRFSKSSAPLLMIPPLVPLSTANQRAQHQSQLQPQRLSERNPNQRMDYNFSKSAAEVGTFHRNSDTTNCSILQQAAACDAATGGIAAGAGAIGTVGRPSGIIMSLFSRDSAGSHWFTPSPNPSNHAPPAGSLAYHTSRSTLYLTGGGSCAAAATGEYSSILGTNAGATSPGLQAGLIQPLSGGVGASGGGGGVGITGTRCRSTLVPTCSRLHFSTTPNTQPSIPENTQALDMAEDSLLSGGTSSGQGGRAGQREGGRLLLNSFIHSGDSTGYSNLPSICGSGVRSPCVAALPRTLLLPAAASAVAGNSLSTASIAGAGSGSGSSPSEVIDGGCSLPACFPLANANHPKSPWIEQSQRAQRESSYVRPMTGLLAAALAAAANMQSSGQIQGVGPGRCHAIPSGVGSGVAGGLAATPHLQTPPPGRVAQAVPQAIGDPRHVRSSAGYNSRSCTTSTVMSHSTVTTSSVKRISGSLILPGLAQMQARNAGGGGPVTAPGGIGMAVGVSSALDTTPSGNGVVAGAVASGSTPDGVLYTGSGGGVTMAPPPTFAGDSEEDQKETLERGWRTLQQIMQRLNAKPGDYLTRIVMENADQGSLLGALRDGRFGVAGERLTALLLTALDIARGVAFLHSHNIIHGDLKPSNVLLCSDAADPRGFIAKVSDFGLSRVLINRDTDFVQSREAFPAGTVRYLAPEAVSGSLFKASDVWSFAIILWQLATGAQAPWPGLRSMQIIMGVMQDELRLQVPAAVHPPLANLIESCLCYDHKARPTFDDVIQKLQAMLRDISRQFEPQMQTFVGAAILGGFPSSAAGTAAAPPAPPPAGPLEGLASTVPSWSNNPIFHSYEEESDRSQGAISGSAEAPLSTGPAAVPEPGSAHSSTTSAAAIRPVIATTVALPLGITPAFTRSTIAPTSPASPEPTTAAVAVMVVPTVAKAHTRSHDSEGIEIEEMQVHIAGPTSTSQSGTGSPSASCLSSTASSERDQPRAQMALTPMSGRTTGRAGGGSLNTAHCSLAATFTGVSSSNALTQMSSSWAQTATTTTLGGAMLDFDPRIGAASSAWHSSAFHLGAGTQVNASNPLVGVGAGSVSSSGLHPLCRTMVVGSSTCGGSSHAGALALTLERQCLPELFSRSRTYLGAVLPDEPCNGIAGRVGDSNQLPIYMGMHGRPTEFCGVQRVGGGLAFHTANLILGGGSTAAAVEANQFSLPPVHEEQPPTSSSGVQTLGTHGSGLSSGITQVSAGIGPSSGPGDGQATTVSSQQINPAVYGGVEGSLPRLLQAGLIVIGALESGARNNSGGQSPRFRTLDDSGSSASTGNGEEQRQQQALQQVRHGVASLDSLPFGLPSFSRLSGRSD